jgi:hypothetical protein
MDNLFQLLIFLFVIYTIFNSAFGKKKSQKTARRIPQDDQAEVPERTSAQSKDSSADILQELFGFKVPKTGGEYEQYNRKEYGADLETDLQGAEGQSSVQAPLPEVDYDKLPSLESAQNTIQPEDYHTVYENRSSLNQRTLDILQKIRDPKTLRELIVVSEILNKPKALRR